MGLLDRIFGRRRETTVVCAVDPDIQAESQALQERERRLRDLETEMRLATFRQRPPDDEHRPD